jgi:hypothetical protein
MNDKRFGPAIFEAHVKTTVRENYFNWIFQQLSDIDDIEDDAAIDEFKMEYDEDIYTNLPKTLVCSHKDMTRFPFKNCEIYYGEDFETGDKSNDHDEDLESYCSAQSGAENSLSTNEEPNQVGPMRSSSQDPVESPVQERQQKTFSLVYKLRNHKKYRELREQQRNIYRPRIVQVVAYE